jgi:hypothetical protein
MPRDFSVCAICEISGRAAFSPYQDDWYDGAPRKRTKAKLVFYLPSLNSKRSQEKIKIIRRSEAYEGL